MLTPLEIVVAAALFATLLLWSIGLLLAACETNNVLSNFAEFTARVDFSYMVGVIGSVACASAYAHFWICVVLTVAIMALYAVQSFLLSHSEATA